MCTPSKLWILNYFQDMRSYFLRRFSIWLFHLRISNSMACRYHINSLSIKCSNYHYKRCIVCLMTKNNPIYRPNIYFRLEPTLSNKVWLSARMLSLKDNIHKCTSHISCLTNTTRSYCELYTRHQTNCILLRTR